MSRKIPGYRVLRVFYMAYIGFADSFVSRIPSTTLRYLIYKYLYFMKLGKGVHIGMGVKFKRPRSITLGDYSVINPRCIIDGRQVMTIGSNVDIGEDVAMYCGSHDIQGEDYLENASTTTIGDRACIYARAMLIKGVDIGEGAVVGAGSIVTKNVEAYAIVAGNPAKKIGERSRNLTYTLDSKTVNQSWL